MSLRQWYNLWLKPNMPSRVLANTLEDFIMSNASMTAKEYLKQIPALDAVIRRKRHELNDLREMATAIGSFDYSRDRVQTSPSGEAPYTRMAEKVAELDAELAALEEERLGIIDVIYTLDDERQIEALYMRHVEGRSVRRVADLVHCGLSTAYRLINDAYEKIGNK